MEDVLILNQHLGHLLEDFDCFNGGRAIRCVVKPKPKLSTTPANEFKFLMYNIFERFYFVSVDGQRERTCRIPSWILETIPDVDAIAFQEVFLGGCDENNLSLKKVLSYYGFKYAKSIVDSILAINGGIFITSKWPIVREESYIFKAVIFFTAEIFVAKGVSYARIEKTVNGVTMLYNLMSTHLQSGGGDDNTIREAQCQEMASFTQTLNIPANESVLYAGDLNYRLDELSLQTCVNLLNSN
ncbi:DgyrCDS14697 [Dimorphilus gyrociliatus]|uniref:sphingomyelin phosphodiesterase n=1 Tax=Dimorphilus gyrociliatus TaxID=2664684 RepID=A0A7I8WEK2_9ANNE|nr:DgyrCDS14697 [Dimorphilus gyrociliatus]